MKWDEIIAGVEVLSLRIAPPKKTLTSEEETKLKLQQLLLERAALDEEAAGIEAIASARAARIVLLQYDPTDEALN